MHTYIHTYINTYIRCVYTKLFMYILVRIRIEEEVMYVIFSFIRYIDLNVLQPLLQKAHKKYINLFSFTAEIEATELRKCVLIICNKITVFVA